MTELFSNELVSCNWVPRKKDAENKKNDYEAV